MKILVILFLGLALILAFLGTITNRWYQSLSNDFHEGLWWFCQRFSSDSSSSTSTVNCCRRQPFVKSQALAISGIILLFIAFVSSIVYFYQKTARLFVYFIILILIASTLLLIFSYLLYSRSPHSRQLGYSIYFMLISSILVLISTALITFLAKTIRPTPPTIYLNWICLRFPFPHQQIKRQFNILRQVNLLCDPYQKI